VLQGAPVAKVCYKLCMKKSNNTYYLQPCKIEAATKTY
jgi:hypothetical protein